jgi:hypothetical protein
MSSRNIGNQEKWSPIPMCLFNQRSGLAVVKSIYRASRPRFTMFPLSQLPKMPKGTCRSHHPRSKTLETELSNLHYPIKWIVRQYCVMRLKMIRFSRYQRATFLEEGTSYNRDGKVLIPIILILSYTSKCIRRNHSLLLWSLLLL